MCYVKCRYGEIHTVLLSKRTQERKMNNNNNAQKVQSWKYVQCARGARGTLAGALGGAPLKSSLLTCKLEGEQRLPDGRAGRASYGTGT